MTRDDAGSVPMGATTLGWVTAGAVALSAGCHDASLTEWRDDAEAVLDGARLRADELRELSAEELEDLWAIEYTSLGVVHDDLVRIDEILNRMGRERWECYHVSENEQGRIFFFKRNKSNATAYLTNLLRLGAVAF